MFVGAVAFAGNVSGSVADNPIMAMVSEKNPILVVRFNKKDVYYEKSLEKVIAQAIAVNSDIKFTIFGVVQSESSQGYVGRRMRHMANILVRSGISDDHIVMYYQRDGKIASDEIRIYVE